MQITTCRYATDGLMSYYRNNEGSVICNATKDNIRITQCYQGYPLRELLSKFKNLIRYGS